MASRPVYPKVDAVGTVYLLHFSRPYRHARHYLGFSSKLDQRMKEHLKARGAALMRAVKRAGIDFYLARVWEHVTVKFERRGHGRPGKADICPICVGPRALRRHRPFADEVSPGSNTGLLATRRKLRPRGRKTGWRLDDATGERR